MGATKPTIPTDKTPVLLSKVIGASIRKPATAFNGTKAADQTSLKISNSSCETTPNDLVEDQSFPGCEVAHEESQSSLSQSLHFNAGFKAALEDVRDFSNAQHALPSALPSQAVPFELQESHPPQATDVVYAVNRWISFYSRITEYGNEEHGVLRVFDDLGAANAAAPKLLTLNEGDGFEVDSKVLEDGGIALHAERVNPSGSISIIDLEVQKVRLHTALPLPPSTTAPASSLPAGVETYCSWRTATQFNDCTVYALGTFPNEREADKVSRRAMARELSRLHNEGLEEPVEGDDGSSGSIGVAVLESIGNAGP